MNITLDNIIFEVKKAWGYQYDGMPLATDAEINADILKYAEEYKAYRLLAMWIMYIQDDGERRWGVGIEKFLTTAKLNKWAAQLGNRQRREKEEEQRRRDYMEHPPSPDPAIVLAGNIEALKREAATVDKAVLAEILHKTAAHAWYYDNLDVPRPAELTGPGVALFEPRNLDVLAKLDAVKQWKAQGYIEWDELMLTILHPAVFKGCAVRIEPKHGALWSPTSVGSYRIDITGQSVVDDLDDNFF